MGPKGQPHASPGHRPGSADSGGATLRFARSHATINCMTRSELFTVGHSNLDAAKFLDLLGRHDIEVLVDVRRFPGSRSFPHFNAESLSKTLVDNGIDYYWIEELGGRRAKSAGRTSQNTGLRNASFRNYADYMQTDAFRAGIDRLTQIAAEKRTVIMCAESVYWRCHRRLVADFLLAHDWTIHHIFPTGETRPHQPTAGVRLTDDTVTYPGQQTLFD
jgi:uncharacterized protein (DUF488 family)